MTNKSTRHKFRVHTLKKMTRIAFVILYSLWLFFIHLKLELLAKFPASNDEKEFFQIKLLAIFLKLY